MPDNFKSVMLFYLFTDNEYLKKDVVLRDIACDGLRKLEFPPGTFYEIKTGKFYSTIKKFSETRPSAKKFLEYLKAKAIFGFYREKVPALLCNFEFRYGVRDQEMMKDMQEFFIQAKILDDSVRIFDVTSSCF